MSDRLSPEPSAQARGRSSPIDTYIDPGSRAPPAFSAPTHDHNDEDAVPLCLRPGWTPATTGESSVPPHIEPTLPTIPQRRPVSRAHPLGCSPGFEKCEGVSRGTPSCDGATDHQPPMPTAQQREALLFLAKVQHHSFDAIRLRLNWHHFSDMDIREILLEEMRFRVGVGMPMPVGTGHLALLGAAESEDECKDLFRSGQFTGGWGDAHEGGYYRILLAPEEGSLCRRASTRMPLLYVLLPPTIRPGEGDWQDETPVPEHNERSLSERILWLLG